MKKKNEKNRKHTEQSPAIVALMEIYRDPASDNLALQSRKLMQQALLPVIAKIHRQGWIL
jgi:hypothetical protein